MSDGPDTPTPTSAAADTPRELRSAVTTRRAQWALLAAWGVLYGLAFPPVNAWLLAHLALVPLTLLAVRSTRRWALFFDTWAAATIWWLINAWWIGLTTVGGYVAVCFYLALYVVAFVFIVRGVERAFRGAPLVLLVPIVWTALEYVRGSWVLTGFPWFNLGQSQPTVMIQIADTVGAYGVSFVVAMTSGAICDLLTRPLVRRSESGKRWGIPVTIAAPIWLAAMIASLGYGQAAVSGHPTANKTGAVRIAVIQTDVPQSNKESPTEAEDRRNFARMLELTREAAAADPRPHLIVWPETMAPRPLNDESIAIFRRSGDPGAEYYTQLLSAVREIDVPVIVGAHAYIWSGTGQAGDPWQLLRRYNCAYLIRPTGQVERYDKVHRVPFGEFIPHLDAFPALRHWFFSLTPYRYDYTLSKGEGYTLFDVPVDAPGSGGGGGGAQTTWSVAAPVCFEDVVSYVPRQMVYADDAGGGAKRVDVMVNLSNDGWFLGSAEMVMHEQIARFRCVEVRVPMARSVNRGYAGFIDSCGRVIGTVTNDAGERDGFDGWGVAELARDPRTTIFGRIGDAFAAACFFGTLALIAAPLARTIWNRTRP